MTYTDKLSALKTSLESQIESIGNNESSSKIPEELLSLYAFVCLTLNGGGGGGGPTNWSDIIGNISDNIALSNEFNSKQDKATVTISTNSTINVSTTGSSTPTSPLDGDAFDGIQSVLDWLKNVEFSNNAKLTISFAPGEYVTQPLILDNPNLQYTIWQSATADSGVDLDLNTADNVITKTTLTEAAFDVKIILNADNAYGVTISDDINAGIWRKILFRLFDYENNYSVYGFALGEDNDGKYTKGNSSIDLRDIAIIGFGESIHAIGSTVNCNIGSIYSIPQDFTLYAVNSKGFINNIYECNSSDQAVYLKLSRFEINNLVSSDSDGSIKIESGSFIRVVQLRTYRTSDLDIYNSGADIGSVYSDDLRATLFNSRVSVSSINVNQSSISSPPITLIKGSFLAANYVGVQSDINTFAVDVTDLSTASFSSVYLTQLDYETPIGIRALSGGKVLLPSSYTATLTPALGVIGTSGEVIYSL